MDSLLVLELVARTVYEEEQRAKQDEEEKQKQNEKKILFYSKNLTWGSRYSSSSSSSSPPSSSTNPSSPDPCLTENKGLKRRAVSDGERKGRAKKAKVHQSSPKAVRETPSSPETERETPSWLVEMIKDMNGENPTFIFEKKLTTTDVNPSQSRLLIPLSGLKRNDFLTPEELSTIQEYENKKKNKKKGVRVMVVTSMLRTWNLKLKTWDMTKPNYSITSGWNNVVKDNELKEGVNIGLWSFRSNGTLCFGLARLT